MLRRSMTPVAQPADARGDCHCEPAESLPFRQMRSTRRRRSAAARPSPEFRARHPGTPPRPPTSVCGARSHLRPPLIRPSTHASRSWTRCAPLRVASTASAPAARTSTADRPCRSVICAAATQVTLVTTSQPSMAFAPRSRAAPRRGAAERSGSGGRSGGHDRAGDIVRRSRHPADRRRTGDRAWACAGRERDRDTWSCPRARPTAPRRSSRPPCAR